VGHVTRYSCLELRWCTESDGVSALARFSLQPTISWYPDDRYPNHPLPRQNKVPAKPFGSLTAPATSQNYNQTRPPDADPLQRRLPRIYLTYKIPSTSPPPPNNLILRLLSLRRRPTSRTPPFQNTVTRESSHRSLGISKLKSLASWIKVLRWKRGVGDVQVGPKVQRRRLGSVRTRIVRISRRINRNNVGMGDAGER